MKDYHEMAERVLNRRDQYVVERKKRMKQLTATISCLCLCALVGIGAWRSGVFNAELPADKPPVGSEHGTALDEFRQEAAQKQPTVSQPENSGHSEAWSKEDTADSDKVITIDGALLAPQVTRLTQDELYNAVSGLLPDKAPDGFLFESASFSAYGYSVIWYRGLEELNWRIRDYKDADANRITSVADTQNYDLALYPIPRADSVPDELREIVNDPIFRVEDLTQEAVYARAYKVNEAGDSDGYRMSFSVLCGDKVISVTSKGVSPEWLFHQLKALTDTFDAPVQNEVGNTGALSPFDEVWGGSYMDADGHWVVWLTEDTPENRVEVFQRNPTLLESSTEFRKADYTLAYLTQLMADISTAMGEKQLPFVSSASLREDFNRIEISMTDETVEFITQVQSFDALGGAIIFRYGTLISEATNDVLKAPTE